jgi:predicted RNA-binding protein YlxR (DUF448 family)
MVRVVRRADGTLAVDRRGPGRGAWLCSGSLGCLDVAVRRHGFDRAFRAPIGRNAAQHLRDELGTLWRGPTDDVRG